ncbi:MAG: aminotransferase class V-fold PLP-dependent enzyme [Thermoanaerobaculia bacterium]
MTSTHHSTTNGNKRHWDDARARFAERYPAFAGTAALDSTRAAELRRLDSAGQVYLDYTGAGLYPESLITEHSRLLASRVLGNPHSVNPASVASSELVDLTRRRILDWFNASPDEYEVIFTANASGALKLLGESYPFAEGDTYLLSWDNHNSVNGIREFARRRGAEYRYVPLLRPDLRFDEERLTAELDRLGGAHRLFAFPAQSNFSGVQHPLEWIERAQKRGWHVLLDAAAFAPTNRLDLGQWHPDFVTLSFYKMFGYPTGIGALLARRDALAVLERPWFSGGSINVVSVQIERYIPAEGAARFEDGTLDFLNIPAVAAGLDFLERTGRDAVHDRVAMLTDWLLGELTDLRHAGGKPLVRIYGPLSREKRGGTISFNIYDGAGTLVDQDRIEQRAAESGISIRTGCFCNPGAAEAALMLDGDKIEACLDHLGPAALQHDFRSCLGAATGAVRVSLGWGSTFTDLCRLLDFLRRFTA